MKRFAAQVVFGLATLPAAPGAPAQPAADFGAADALADSGLRRADAPGVLFATSIRIEDAAWLRLRFGACALAGDPGSDGSQIRITSMLDGAVQTLDAQSLRWWSDSSAYFNGPEVLVELISRGGRGGSRLVITGVSSEAHSNGYARRSICGPTDDRTPSGEPANARLVPAGCTAWLFDDANRTFLTAGHCSLASGTVAEFNVPLSNPDGTMVHPPPEHQYPVEPTSVQSQDAGLGSDWAYFACFPNSITGLTPFQAQGARSYSIAATHPAAAGQALRVTGYGTVSPPSSPTLNQVQQTHVGAYGGATGTTLFHYADTGGTNSGSPMVDLSTKLVIGIHTNGGCSTTDPSPANIGCSIGQAGLRAALSSPRGLCRSGLGAPAGDVLVSADLNNNLGLINATTGAFARTSRVGPFTQGMAYDWLRERAFLLDSAGGVSTVEPATGVVTVLGQVSGAAGSLSSLAFDPWRGVLFAADQASGQLYTIDPESLAAAAVGAPLGGNVGALDFDPVARRLYGLDDAPGGTRLIRIDAQTGARTDVGPLGPGITDCNGLAAGSGRLYTINAGTEQFLQISPATGAASVIGPTNGLFGAGYGMAIRLSAPPCVHTDYNQDGGADNADVTDLASDIASGTQTYPGSSPDFNQDGGADNSDVGDLAQAISGGC